MTRIAREDGFTLIELLVVAAISLVVFGATLAVLQAVTNSYQGSTQRNDAQDRARLAIDRIGRQLRNISSPISAPKLIERATPYDLVFQTVSNPSGSNTSGAERVRYCVPNDSVGGSSALEVLVSQVQTWTTATPPASPWSSNPAVTIPCPDSSTATSQILAASVTSRYQQRTDRPVFTFNNGTAPSDLSQITSVQTDLFVNPTTQVSAAERELRTGVYLRNQLRAPVAAFSVTTTGNGGVLLNGGIAYSPSGYDLSYAWSCTSASCPSSAALSSSTTGLVDWVPGAGTYTVQLTVTDTNGLSSTTSQSLTVQ